MEEVVDMDEEDLAISSYSAADAAFDAVDLLEKHLEQQLMERIAGFNMKTFTELLMQHKEEVSGDIFDMLLTFTDFMAFKEMFLEYKAEKEGRGVDLSQGLVVTSLLPAASKQTSSTESQGQASYCSGCEMAVEVEAAIRVDRCCVGQECKARDGVEFSLDAEQDHEEEDGGEEPQRDGHKQHPAIGRLPPVGAPAIKAQWSNPRTWR
ncbi:hypothetical protein INR49_026543, partial [Caranx melampygus]